MGCPQPIVTNSSRKKRKERGKKKEKKKKKPNPDSPQNSTMNVPKMRTDPRIRQNLNQLSSTIESATDTARAGCFAFTKTYLEPLIDSISSCCSRCSHCCSYIPDDSLSHHSHPTHGRGRNNELPFDFYNDDYWYDYDDGGRGPDGGFLAWGTDELDRLLAGSSSGHRSSPGMYYGGASSSAAGGGVTGDIRSGTLGLIGGRRKRHSTTQPDGRGAPDPTVIPSTSVFGFLSRFPWWKRTELRYRPSAAGLQEHPGMPRQFPNYTDDDDDRQGGHDELRQSLLNGTSQRNASAVGRMDTSRIYQQYPSSRGRKRSQTDSSHTSGESFRSRRDLFPSDGEDDAVPLGDEFSIVLRSSASGGGSGASDIDGEASMTGLRRESIMSGNSSTQGMGIGRRSFIGDTQHPDLEHEGDDEGGDGGGDTPRALGPVDDTILRTQEAAIAEAEEREIERKRALARKLAFERGLNQHIQSAGLPQNPSRIYSPPRSPSHGLIYSHPQSRSSPPLSPRNTAAASIAPVTKKGDINRAVSPPAVSPRTHPVLHSNLYPHSPPSHSINQRPSPAFHAQAAAALARPMSPISPLAGTPARGMSPPTSPPSLSPMPMTASPMMYPGTNTRTMEVVEPFTAPPSIPRVDAITEHPEGETESEIEVEDVQI